MKTKEEMFTAGVELAQKFCQVNGIEMPRVERLEPGDDRRYYIGTCAYYRPKTIHIMVPKCAHRGMGGRAWSWPGYVIDRTPFGVIQHELGHHVDFHPPLKRENNFENARGTAFVFSKFIYDQSLEEPLTGYLGTDKEAVTFYMEWFAENFRLFVTNPDLSAALRPKFYQAMLAAGLKPVVTESWEIRLVELEATARILEMARKKVGQVQSDIAFVEKELAHAEDAKGAEGKHPQMAPICADSENGTSLRESVKSAD